MIKSLLVLSSIFLSSLSFALDSSRVLLKRLYVDAGIHFQELQSPVYTFFNASLNAEIGNSYLLAFRFYEMAWKDPNYPTPNDQICFGCPVHDLIELNLSGGKAFELNKWADLNFSTGPSYIIYTKPENITPTPPGTILGYYDFNNVEYHLFGWSARLDFLLHFPRTVGLTTGLYFNYNKVQPSAGAHINLVLGKLRNIKWNTFSRPAFL